MLKSNDGIYITIIQEMQTKYPNMIKCENFLESFSIEWGLQMYCISPDIYIYKDLEHSDMWRCTFRKVLTTLLSDGFFVTVSAIERYDDKICIGAFKNGLVL